MSVYFPNTPYGDLKLYEVLYFYDEPQLFICINEKEQLFITIISDSDSEHTEWICSYIGKAEYKQLCSSTISLYNAFKSGEKKALKIISNANDRNNYSFSMINSIEDKKLPAQDAFISSFKDMDEEEIQFAGKPMSDCLKIHFFTAAESHEIAADILSTVLQVIQRLIRYLSPNARKTNAIGKKYQLNAFALEAGSVIVKLRSDSDPTLFGDTESTSGIVKLIRLLNAEGNTGIYSDIFREANVKTAANLRGFIRNLIDNKMEIDLEYQYPDSITYRSKLNNASMVRIINELEARTKEPSETKQLTGELMMYNAKNHDFIMKLDSKDVIRGKVSESLSKEIFSLPQRYQVIIEVDYETIPSTGEEIVRNTMINIKRLTME